jgi:hypothetical protein
MRELVFMGDLKPPGKELLQIKQLIFHFHIYYSKLHKLRVLFADRRMLETFLCRSHSNENRSQIARLLIG